MITARARRGGHGIAWATLTVAALLTLTACSAAGFTPTPLPLPPVQEGTALPTAANLITPANAGALRPLAQWNLGLNVFRVNFTPDGHTFIVETERGLQFWHLPDNTRLPIPGEGLGSVLAITADGQTLVTASGHHSVDFRRLADGASLRSLPGLPGDYIAVAPDGQTGASATDLGGHQVWLWRGSDGTLLHTFTWPDNTPNVLAFAPDSQILAVGTLAGAVRLWQVADGTLLHTLGGHTNTIHSLAFTADGKMLAAASADRSVGLWRVADGSAVQHLTGSMDKLFTVAFSPDGQLLAAGDLNGVVWLWRVADGQPLGHLAGDTKAVYGLAFSPDGHLLAGGSVDGTVRLWGVR
ncbi:MAG: WD40 repeat domain-containing protein [Chloroflexota bacterium]|nr:WD40 repeat domain-containing protein [Chloroflexota bacterium]